MTFYHFIVVYVCGFLLHENRVLALEIPPKHILILRILCVGLIWYVLWIALLLPLLLQIPLVESIFTFFFTLSKETFPQLNIDSPSREYASYTSLALPLIFFIICHVLYHYIKIYRHGTLFKIYEKILSKSEDPMRLELLNYYRNRSIFLLTLKNNKTYVGKLASIPAIYFDINSVSILPIGSGYRDKKGMLEITTNYAHFSKRFNQDQNSSSPHWPQVVVKYEEVVSIQSFSPEDYKTYFEKRNVDEKDEDRID